MDRQERRVLSTCERSLMNDGLAEWRFLGTCAILRGPVQDSETISIGGISPWRHNWKTLRGGVPIILPDPACRSREHWFKVYEIRDGDICLRFAAGDMAENLWGFYVPALPGEPGARIAREPEYEGYWRVSIDEASLLPWPIPYQSWEARAAFLEILDSVEANAERIAYRGHSYCRLCGCLNGHEGIRLAGWEWPAGFRHYIADHEVRPSPAFESFVLKFRQPARQPGARVDSGLANG